MPDDYDALGPVLITNTTLVETARLLTVEHEEREFDWSRPSSHLISG